MTTIRKTATIAELEGIRISDPSYTRGMPYRYEAATKARNVQMELITRRDESYGIRYVEFSLILQPKDAPQGLIEMADDQMTFGYPAVYRKKMVEVGMDTACVYIGQSGSKEGELQGVLCTGTDGLFGQVVHFTHNRKWAGTVLMASIDECFATPESLWNHLKATFRAEE